MTRPLALLAALLIPITGCGTIANVATTPHGPAIYGGIVFDVGLTDSSSGSKGGGALFGVLDFPLSLVLDTVTLPVTLLCEIFGWRR